MDLVFQGKKKNDCRMLTYMYKLNTEYVLVAVQLEASINLKSICNS